VGVGLSRSQILDADVAPAVDPHRGELAVVIQPLMMVRGSPDRWAAVVTVSRSVGTSCCCSSNCCCTMGIGYRE
jgi:hypothetical protein